MSTTRTVLSPLLVALLFLAASVSALAQRVRWEPAGGSLALRQTSDLSLIFEDCEPAGGYTLPAVPDLVFGPPNRGEQSSFQIINGQASKRKTVYFTYSVRPTEKTRIVIPAFDVETDSGTMRVESVSFEVGEATVGGSAVPLENAANSEITVGSGGQLWAGEVVPVTYSLSVDSRFPAQIASAPSWEPAPLVHEEWSQPEPFNSVVNGNARSSVLYRTRGYIRAPGTHTIDSIEQLVNLRVPSAGFSVFQQFQAEQYTITSNAPSVVVRPLPGNAPPSFNGGVGEFTFTAQVVPEKPTVGEPVTWTITLTGTGNWPDIPGLPSREVSRDFRVVQPQAKRTPVEGELFEATLSEDVVLIPTRAGSYTLAPVRWSFFDPKSGQYRTLSTEPVTLEVSPAVSAPAPTGQTNQSPTFGIPDPNADDDATPTIRATPAPASPPALLRDPLPSGHLAASPWSPRVLIIVIAALLALVIPWWLGLAARRAWLADPGRAARAARQRLTATLNALASTTDPDRQKVLIAAWQRDSAILWNTRHQFPPASTFAAVRDWPQLWREADAFLFRPDGTLPTDWVPRAQSALQARRAPSFPVAAVLHPRNIVPSLGLLLAVALAAPDSARAADPVAPATDPVADYAAGKFAAAASAWQAQIKANPTDWAAHHNLSLALAQQKQWSLAAAQATVAFVQQPGDPVVAWNFAHTLDRAGFTPPYLGAFVEPDWRHRLAQTFSPAGWQRVALLAAVLVTLALGLALWSGYRRRAFLGRWFHRGLGIIGLTLGVAVGLALPLYGPAQYHDAVLVSRSTQLRSVPTDLAAEQETSALAAGSLARVDGSFLGWRRLKFPNDQTGWVRVEELTPIWTAR